MNRIVAALLAADRPRAARVALRGLERVVAPLPVRDADRVDRRQVDHVEAELGQLRQHLLDPLEAAPAAREELVPGAEAGAERARRRPRAACRGSSSRGGPSRRAPAPLRATRRGRRGRRAPPPPRARRRARSGRPRACGRARRAASRSGRPRPRACTARRPRPVSWKLPAQRSLPSGSSGRLEPLARADGAVADDGAQDVVAVLEDRRRDADRISLRDLDGIPSAVDLRAHVLDLDPGRWLLEGRCGHGSVTFSERRSSNSDEASTIQRRRAAPDLATERQARRRRIRIRRLARRRRAELVAGAAARPAGRARLAVRLRVGVRRLGRLPRPPRRARREARARRVPPRERLLDRRLGGGRRQRRGPAPLRPRVVGAARLCGRARRPADRRHADLRRAGQRRPPHAPRPLPVGARRRRAAGRPRPDGPALGQSALRLGGGRPGRLPLVDRAASPPAGPGRPDADRPLPRLRRVLGDPGGRARRPFGKLAPRARRGRLRGRRSRARPAPRDRGGPRPDHAGRARAARPPRLPRNGRLALGVPGPARRTRTGSRTTASTRPSTRARTTPTPCAAAFPAATPGS